MKKQTRVPCPQAAYLLFEKPTVKQLEGIEEVQNMKDYVK